MQKKRANTFINWFFLCVLVLFVVLLGRVIYARNAYPPGTVEKHLATSLVGILASSAALRLQPHYKVNIALSLLSVMGGIYLIEILLFCCVPRPNSVELRARAADKVGISFDRRTKYEVFLDLRQEGIDAYPSVSVSNLVVSDWMSVKADIALPLAGISGKMTVLCNESGEYATYLADEHGFNNPVGLFAQGSVDVVLIGDSFTHGNCVPQGHDIASHLRRTRERTLNLGYTGNGPLAELATLKEYAAPLRPAVVLWLYHEGNDLSDLQVREQATPLVDYLDSDFSKSLIDRQAEIDEALMHYVAMRAEQVETNGGAEDRVALGTALARTVRLAHLRERVQMLSQPQEPPPSRLFVDVLAAARDLTASWGGRLYFVYLPSWSRYAREVGDDELFHRAEVLSIVESLDIPIVDVHQTFAGHPDPLSLFPFRMEGHYTSEGYGLVAAAIEKYWETGPGDADPVKR